VALAAVEGDLRARLVDATEALARACIQACASPALADAA
jgi:hypothetical protein